MNAGDIDALLMFSFYSLTHYILENVSIIYGMVLCVMFCRSVFVLCTFSFGHCVVGPSLIYDHHTFANRFLNQIRIFEYLIKETSMQT